MYLVRPVAPLLASLGRGSSPVGAVTTLVRYGGRSVSSGGGGARRPIAAATGRFGSTVRRPVPSCRRLTASTVALRFSRDRWASVQHDKKMHGEVKKNNQTPGGCFHITPHTVLRTKAS